LRALVNGANVRSHQEGTGERKGKHAWDIG
jgi:hypothetical protein